ncbi:RNA polymerase sigma factor [Frankia sp. R82]|uniref:RNA polymerase sigma factor n=1 Tax=Frankia sp. R82 TaxID=2950553 RepID=UPI00204333F8|nr:RNA polymerase sigma factor [Frankia sp. R82]
MVALAEGDAGAVRVLYERHAPAMLRLLRRLTPSAQTAEELLQEAWIAVWQSASSFRGDASVRAWLLGVTRRQAHNRLRRGMVVEVDLDAAELVADQAVDVENEVLATASHGAIMNAIDALPHHLREVVMLALVEELPYRDIAAIVDVPVGTVKSRMSHARARLCRSLAELGIQR